MDCAPRQHAGDIAQVIGRAIGLLPALEAQEVGAGLHFNVGQFGDHLHFHGREGEGYEVRERVEVGVVIGFGSCLSLLDGGNRGPPLATDLDQLLHPVHAPL